MQLLGGLALFLFGLGLLGEGLGRLLGRGGLAWGMATPFRGFILGLGLGAVSASGTALALSAMGLLEARLVSLSWAVLFALASGAGASLAVVFAVLNLGALALPLLALGYFLGLVPGLWAWGRAGFGLGLLLLGLGVMGEAGKVLVQAPLFQVLLKVLSASPLGVFALGGVLGLFLHSNGVAALALALALGGMGVKAALALVLGGGVGSGVFLVFSARGVAGRRMAYGVVLTRLLLGFFLLLALPFLPNGPVGGVVFAAHVGFHLASALVYPLLDRPLTRLLFSLLPEEDKTAPKYLSEEALASPALAYSLALREVGRIGDQVREMMSLALRRIAQGEAVSEGEVRFFEDKVDRLTREVVLYAADLAKGLGEKAVRLLWAASELEHMADLVRRILRQVERLEGQGLSFSPEGRAELAEAMARVYRRLERATTALATGNRELALEVVQGRPEMEVFLDRLRRAHLLRLEAGRQESRATTLAHLDLLITLDDLDQGVYRVASLVPEVYA
ncbi:MAG: Na/Pi cotransporter family protein [Thermoleophilia bacterium]